ncbi:MAG: YraN family protein [Clostridia bacterium]|nr:YraN family protein [Clostridia bacterium]
MNIGKVGETGENKVASFLRKRGYAIVKRNFQCRYGEIDIIAENDEYIIFVEVKTRKQNSLVSGVEAVNAFKQRRITLTANDYIVKTECQKQSRFDVALVTVYERSDETLGYKLKYIENAW